jgi:VanZ family protein
MISAMPHHRPEAAARSRPSDPLVIAAARALLALLVVAIGWLALSPRPPTLFSTGWDKANHLLAFATLAAAASFGWVAARRRVAIAFWLLGYGALIEVLQHWVPGRSSEFADLVADAVGIAFGLWLAGWLQRATLR